MRSFEKVYNTFDKDVVKQCQLFGGYLNILHYYSLKSMSFLSKMYFSPNLLVQLIYRYSGHDDIYRLSNIFNTNFDVFANDYRNIIYNQFITG